MMADFESRRFRFREDLALKNSLYSIAEFVLAEAQKVSGATSAVFLYSAPGSSRFEKVATLGLSGEEDKQWSECERKPLTKEGKSQNPLVDAMLSQLFIEVSAKKFTETVSENLTETMAFPLKDGDFVSAGFLLSFAQAKKVSAEAREFLFWLAGVAEKALFQIDSEGV